MQYPIRFPSHEELPPGPGQRKSAAITGEALRSGVQDLGKVAGLHGAVLLLPGAETLARLLGTTTPTIQKIVQSRTTEPVRNFADILQIVTGCNAETHNGYVLQLPPESLGESPDEGLRAAQDVEISTSEKQLAAAEAMVANHSQAEVLGFMQVLAGVLIHRSSL